MRSARDARTRRRGRREHSPDCCGHGLTNTAEFGWRSRPGARTRGRFERHARRAGRSAHVDCLRSGWLTTGARCAQFERDFAAFVGGDVQTLAVSSCTAAPRDRPMSRWKSGLGDEVITTDFTFSATAMSAVHVGVTPVLVDIDPDTFNIDCKKIEQAITDRTKAIMPVHYAGLACNMKAIRDIAGRHGLKIVEDAAHALPATAEGAMVGSGTSDARCVQLLCQQKPSPPAKGGMITFADPAAAARAQTLRLHGIDRDVFARYQVPNAGWRYEIVAPGFKSNLTDVAAAMGIVQLKRAWSLHKSVALSFGQRYDEALAGAAPCSYCRPKRLPAKFMPATSTRFASPTRLRSNGMNS